MRAAGSDFSQDGAPFLKKYCLEGRSGDDPKAELSLEGYTDSASVVKGRKIFEKVLRMLAIGEMPPKKKPRPTVVAVEAFTDHVKVRSLPRFKSSPACSVADLDFHFGFLAVAGGGGGVPKEEIAGAVDESLGLHDYFDLRFKWCRARPHSRVVIMCRHIWR